ncbi:MAG: type II secretion system protein, partial [Phycisphaerales bacterium]
MLGATRTGRRAFTLIELLVVIALIALLIGILMPALAGARRAARTTKCLANVRSVSQSLTMYANAARDRFPHWSAWQTYHGDGSSSEDTPGAGWVELMEPQVSTLEMFQCASRRQGDLPVAFFLQSRYTSLLHNAQFFTSISMPQVHFASEFVLMGDATNKSLLAAPYGTPHLVHNYDPDDARWQAVFYPGEE